MSPLPHDFDDDAYWRDIYKQPLAFWQDTLQSIVAAHNLPDDEWSRASLGRNVVFISPTAVIKLGPPFWLGEMAREVAALNFVAGRLPVDIPAFIATGTVDGWDYLVQQRLPGTNLHSLWQQLDATAKAKLARQHGALMAVLHSLPLDVVPDVLHFDWAEMLGGQRDCCASDMAAAGVDGVLVAQIGDYLDATPWHIEQGKEVLLHGDLSHLNFLVAEVDGAWEITGLLDWGDAKIGAPSHDFISPGMHMYRGDQAALWQWYQGYTLLNREQAAEVQRVVMARSMLYYSEGFAKLIQRIPGADACTTWSALASLFLQMDSWGG
jgi:hygromycin-B 7''-O-kinase